MDNKYSFEAWLDFSKTEAGKKFFKNYDSRVTAATSDVKKGSVSKWLKKVDGQDKDGKGGGRLSKAKGVIDQFQGYREKAKWKGDSTPNTIRPGLSKTELAQGDEINDYDSWIRRQDKTKKGNSNYA